MTDSKNANNLEIAEKATIPGVVPGKVRDFWYIEADANVNFDSQFMEFAHVETEAKPSDGGLIHLNCLITTPENLSFMSITFNRDLEGWLSKLREACKIKNLLIAEIKGSDFVISNGESYELSECDIKFYTLEKTKDSKQVFDERFVVIEGVVYKSK